MVIEEHIEIHAPPETVFALYADVASWSTWDPDTKSSSIEGPFQTGAIGRLRPTKGQKIGITFTSVTPNASFTCEAKPPLCTIRFDHELTPTAQGVKALHRVVFTGPLAFFFNLVVGSGVRKGLPHTMAKLKATAEALAVPSE